MGRPCPNHAASLDYALNRFIEDPAFLSDVIRFDLPPLGDIGGLRGAHLQCHIGTDTISLARLGARMTGLDLSPAPLVQARLLAAQACHSVEFFAAELYQAVSVLGSGVFDFVFTGVGALCWLPSIRRCADVVAELLVPSGRLLLREGHPMLWTLRRSEARRVACRRLSVFRARTADDLRGAGHLRRDWKAVRCQVASTRRRARRNGADTCIAVGSLGDGAPYAPLVARLASSWAPAHSDSSPTAHVPTYVAH